MRFLFAFASLDLVNNKTRGPECFTILLATANIDLFGLVNNKMVSILGQCKHVFLI